MYVYLCVRSSVQGKWEAPPSPSEPVALRQEALVKVRVRVRATLGPDLGAGLTKPWKTDGPPTPALLELGSSSISGPQAPFALQRLPLADQPQLLPLNRIQPQALPLTASQTSTSASPQREGHGEQIKLSLVGPWWAPYL